MLLNISDTGVSTTAVVSDLLVGRQTTSANGFIYSVGRQKLDPATLSIAQTYEYPDDQSRSFPRGVLVVADQVLFRIDTDEESPGERYAAFDEATGEYLGLRGIPQLGGFFDNVFSEGIRTAVADGEWVALAGPGGVLVLPIDELVYR